ncbi:MAG: hypothetical protein HWD58_20420 [Bacteroidota bacterium]|nr:MAG: hypothetical protein HWD58_20420 [Bacteroidota bacterium]
MGLHHYQYVFIAALHHFSNNFYLQKSEKNKEVKTNQFQLSFSMGLRIFIVILLAVIIAQPLNVSILKPNSTTLAFDIKDLLSSNPLATIITLAVVAVFLLPVYLKYNIRKLGEFYEKKQKLRKKSSKMITKISKKNTGKFKVIFLITTNLFGEI